MAHTKGDLLLYAIAYALRRVRLKRRTLGLSEEDRYQIAADAVGELRKHGQWKELDDRIEPLPGHP